MASTHIDASGRVSHAEGRATLVDTGDGIFFNAKQTLQRDLTILCLREALSRCDSPLVLDALCGCGVRAIRYALEVPGARLHANDSSRRCIAATRANAEASGASLHEATTSDASSLMLERRHSFDAVDLDPCGSVAELPAAVIASSTVGFSARRRRTLARSLAALATAPLRGTSLSRFAAQKAAPAMAVRTLLACAQRAAAAEGRRAEPLLAVAVAGFYCRVVVRINDDTRAHRRPLATSSRTACGAAVAEPPAAPRRSCARSAAAASSSAAGRCGSAPPHRRRLRARSSARAAAQRGVALAGNLGAAAGGGGGGGRARRARAAADPAARRMPAARLPPASSREPSRRCAAAAIAPPPRARIRRRCRWRKMVSKVRGGALCVGGVCRAGGGQRRRFGGGGGDARAAAPPRRQPLDPQALGFDAPSALRGSSDASAATTAAPPTRRSARVAMRRSQTGRCCRR